MFYLLLACLAWCGLVSCEKKKSVSIPNRPVLASDEALLDTLERLHFTYFWETAHPRTGLIPDRAPTETFSSIAAVGFGLTAYLVGVERGYITRQQAAERTRQTLKFLWEAPQDSVSAGIAGYKGFFYHFLNPSTGQRYQQVELSTIDTGLLLAGILSIQTYFDHQDPIEKEIHQYADSIYRRVDWTWFLNQHQALSMGWHPESGFLESEWVGYNEAMILYILALGSPTHPLQPESWSAWTKGYQWATFEGQEHLNFGPLFGHQYSHMYIDFKGIHDAYTEAKGIDYFENSRRATLSQWAYAKKNPGGFTGYSDKLWGLTACDGPKDTTLNLNGRSVTVHSYWARGAAEGYINDDGTIAPTATGGSVPFAPEVCIPTLREMYTRFGGRLVGAYGFKDAFNLSYPVPGDSIWVDKDYLGIDQGPILLQIENHRSGLVWNLMKRNPYIVQGLQKAGFKGGWLQ